MVEIGFYILPFIMVLLVLRLFEYAPNPKKYSQVYLLVFLVWLIYLIGLTRTDWLDSLELPPRMPLLVILPTIAFSLIITAQKGFKPILEKVPLHFPVYLQAFRILVEFLIWGAFLNGILSKQVTFEGTNFDVLVGLSALVMGYLVQKGKVGKKGLLYWNIASLVVFAGTLASFVYSFYIAQEITLSLSQLPYFFLPGILVAIALFLHIFSIRQCLLKVWARIEL
ncbi:hypothetical protein [Sediminicola luteus]|nr:hypothetical protein [Sediminicola luteus]